MNILQNIFNTLTRFEGIWKGALFLVALLVLCPLLAKAQGSSVQLNNLWKDYDQAMEKDLPQTCLKILDKISKKSESEKAYASLLKAELKKVEIMDELAPDSVEIMTRNLLNKTEKMKKISNCKILFFFSRNIENYFSLLIFLNYSIAK